VDDLEWPRTVKNVLAVLNRGDAKIYMAAYLLSKEVMSCQAACEFMFWCYLTSIHWTWKITIVNSQYFQKDITFVQFRLTIVYSRAILANLALLYSHELMQNLFHIDTFCPVTGSQYSTGVKYSNPLSCTTTRRPIGISNCPWSHCQSSPTTFLADRCKCKCPLSSFHDCITINSKKPALI